MNARFFARLNNWGNWCCYDNDIGPDRPRCVSIESTHIPDTGDVWDSPDEPTRAVPNVADAESMNELIQQLPHMERFCLSLRYGGMPAVFRMRRISPEVQDHMATNAEVLLCEILKRRE